MRQPGTFLAAFESVPERHGLARRLGIWRHALPSPEELWPKGVYILAYHSVPNLARAGEWEIAYHRVATSVDYFRSHLRYLMSFMVPIPLSDVPRVLSGSLDQRYFVMTFDDGYRNILRTAVPILADLRIKPTMFACYDFASGKRTYFRVLLYVLLHRGATGALVEAFRRCFPNDPIDGRTVEAFSKNRYAPGVTEEAVESAWRTACGNEPPPQAFLTIEEIQQLAQRGWEIGNHTRSHPSLSELSDERMENEIEGNAFSFQAAGVPMGRWFAYPQGTARHISLREYQWLLEKGYYGVACSGGCS